MTSDGVPHYVNDGWNRLVKATRREDALTTVATYAWDGLMRRLSKTVTNCGAEEIAGDGGDSTIHYYYDNQWWILETRNGSNQSTRQWVWGTGGTGVSEQNVTGGYCIGVTTVIASSDCIPRRKWAVPTLRHYATGRVL